MNRIKRLAQATSVAAILLAVAAAASAQTTGTPNTSGSVSMSGTVSNFVELNSGGPATLTGNSAGSVTTDGTEDQGLAVVINLGQLNPSNRNSFVKASVPLKIRSNASYVLSMSAVVESSGDASGRKIAASDFGFGLGSVTRAEVVGVNTAGEDTKAAAGDPTAGGEINATTGRFEWAGANDDLGDYSSSATILSGDYIMEPVPTDNTGGLTVPAIFAVKPQFFASATTTAAVTFTVTAP